MNTNIFTTICEAKSTREAELALGRRERVTLTFPGTSILRHALSQALASVASFLF